MNRRFECGLVVGKFCPLHRGHQLLIDTALSHCRELVVISYTRPEFANCSAFERERWLAELYPQTTRLVIDDAILAERCRALGVAPRLPPHNDEDPEAHRAFVAWLCDELLKFRVRCGIHQRRLRGRLRCVTDTLHGTSPRHAESGGAYVR